MVRKKDVSKYTKKELDNIEALRTQASLHFKPDVKGLNVIDEYVALFAKNPLGKT